MFDFHNFSLCFVDCIYMILTHDLKFEFFSIITLSLFNLLVDYDFCFEVFGLIFMLCGLGCSVWLINYDTLSMC